MEDADVPSVWQQLDLPGLVDAHVHFMPRNVMAKVWAYFDAAGPLTGVPWPIAYRTEEEDRLARLRAMGVRAFPSLVYAHKPGMSAWLNAWAADFAARHDDVLHTFTFFPEPGARDDVEAQLRAGAVIGKAHVQVGGYDPRDPLLEEVWGLLADAGTPVVVHCGSGPAPGTFTGPGPFGEVLRRHPRLTAIVAHMGMPEYDEFLTLAETYERVHLDTTMAFTDFAERVAPFPQMLRSRLGHLEHKVLLGSDFPNTPYPYAHQLEALLRLGFGDSWLRSVLFGNGNSLLRRG